MMGKATRAKVRGVGEGPDGCEWDCDAEEGGLGNSDSRFGVIIGGAGRGRLSLTWCRCWYGPDREATSGGCGGRCGGVGGARMWWSRRRREGVLTLCIPQKVASTVFLYDAQEGSERRRQSWMERRPGIELGRRPSGGDIIVRAAAVSVGVRVGRRGGGK